MTMLNANGTSFWEQYPNGVDVYDAWGRRLQQVKACNPETGEVISYGMGWIAQAWHRLLWVKEPHSFCYVWRVRSPWPWIDAPRRGVVSIELLTRHGFHPAPLRVVARRPGVEGTLGRKP